jgi:ABC-type branched-subunit amino acid transport system substrate-binding protein
LEGHDAVSGRYAPDLSGLGVAWAGRELLAGMEVAVQDVNAEGGSGGGRLELVFEDTQGDPDAGVEALRRLHAAGARALVGDANA